MIHNGGKNMDIKKKLIKGIYFVNDKGEETGESLEFFNDGTYSLNLEEKISLEEMICLIKFN